MMKREEIEEGLAQFCGSEEYHRLSPLHDRLVATDGVKWLAESAGAFWLVDAVASWQREAARDPMLREFQLWTLVRNCPGHEHPSGARLTCWRDSEDEAFGQEMEWTDFPLPEISLYVCPGENHLVLMLPSEY